MKYLKLFENFEGYDPYELMMIPPYKKTEMIMDEIRKKGKADLNLVRDLIALGADLDWQDESGWTALHYCAYHNHPEIARVLIEAGADLNIQIDDGNTALHLCAEDNHPEILRMLIDAGADLNIQRDDGKTALHLCAYWGNTLLEIARMLVDAGADKTIKNDEGELPYDFVTSQELTKLLKP